MDKNSPLRRLMSYSKKHRSDIILASVFSISNKLLDIAPPLLIGAAVDIVVRRSNSIFGTIGIKDLKTQLYVLGVLTLFIWLGESLFEYLYKIKWRNLSQTIEHELRLETYNHIQDLELEFFEDRQTGGIMSILNDDINQLERFLDIGANTLIQITTTVVAIEIMFFILSRQVAVYSLIPIPFILIFSIKFQKYLEPRYVTMRNKVGILNGRLSNNLTGIATIKSYTSEKYETERINQSSNEYKQSNVSAIKLSSAFSPLIRVIIVMGFLAMLLVGGFLTLDGKLQIAAYSVIIFLIQRLLWPLTGLGETLDQYQRAMASTTRVLDLLKVEKKIKSGMLYPKNVKGEIILSDIYFDYKSRSNIINDLNVKINSGDTIAFVGPTGAGKSTIVKLLLRFYDPSHGCIYLDGIDIKQFDLNSYRKQIGFVSQDVFLLDGTVKENIIYGRPDATFNEIIESAKIAEIHDFIMSLPDKYETLVGERGQKLSGGQRQRISIARAILKNPPILIFDEATSSVDNETEAAIQRSLEKIIIGRTTILIAHRLSTIRNADQIFVLANGRLIEQGTHESLIEQNGDYAALWRVQTGEKLLINK